MAKGEWKGQSEGWQGVRGHGWKDLYRFLISVGAAAALVQDIVY